MRTNDLPKWLIFSRFVYFRCGFLVEASMLLIICITLIISCKKQVVWDDFGFDPIQRKEQNFLNFKIFSVLLIGASSITFLQPWK